MKKTLVPFVYGRIVTGYEFVNRESEVERVSFDSPPAEIIPKSPILS